MYSGVQSYYHKDSSPYREICTIRVFDNEHQDPAASHEALERIETEISRMLMCPKGRTASQLHSQQYMQFRNLLLRKIHGDAVERMAECCETVSLGLQGLVLLLECQGGECVVTLKWSSSNVIYEHRDQALVYDKVACNQDSDHA